MKIFKKLFLKNKPKVDNKKNNQIINQYEEIGKLVREARIKKKISVEELSHVSKIPEYIIDSIENNLEDNRPKYPFIRSILYKLEDCLSLRKNILVGLLVKERKIQKRNKNELLVRKFDFINTWEGSLVYFLIMILSIFILKKYFFSNVNIIEIQIFEEQIKEK